MASVDIWTDGAASGNPGPGGWASVLCYGKSQKELYGSEPHTTNNRMELMAAIQALETLKRSCHVRVYSDSAYLINPFVKGWLHEWRARGWRSKTGTQVKNADLWERLWSSASSHQVEWIKTRGHADDPMNNRADGLAQMMAQRVKASPSSSLAKPKKLVDSIKERQTCA